MSYDEAIIPPVTAAAKAASRDMVLSVGKGTQDTIRIAEAADPDLAAFLNGQAFLTSRSIYGPIISGLITWLVAYFGFQWDAATVNAVTGLVSVAFGMLFRVLAKAPITGVLSPAPVTPNPQS